MHQPEPHGVNTAHPATPGPVVRHHVTPASFLAPDLRHATSPRATINNINNINQQSNAPRPTRPNTNAHAATTPTHTKDHRRTAPTHAHTPRPRARHPVRNAHGEEKGASPFSQTVNLASPFARNRPCRRPSRPIPDPAHQAPRPSALTPCATCPDPFYLLDRRNFAFHHHSTLHNTPSLLTSRQRPVTMV